MKNNGRKYKITALVSLAVAAVMLSVLLASGVFAEDGVKAVNTTEATYDIADNNPAIYVAQKNANSVVGVITNIEQWNRTTRETSSQTYSEGSGVVIAEGGYILTNYHVVASGDTYQILMPSGEKVDAELTGYDSAYDLAVLKVISDEYVAQLKPVAIGAIDKVYVGSTVIAIGNPGGETLFNTVTSGIISSLARNVDGGNTSRTVEYIQHDAAISSGNSGGGLFDINGNLIGINTLKYAGNSMSGSYEGLGFAIPVSTAYQTACQLIEYGKVQRLGLGVTVQEADGAEEPTEDEIPSGLYVAALTENGPAEKAGIEEGDFIIAIDGERVKTTEQLTDVIDSHEEGDTVTITVARYTEEGAGDDSDGGFTRTATKQGGYYGSPFGGYFFDSPFDDFYDYYNNYRQQIPTYTLEVLDIDVTLEIVN